MKKFLILLIIAVISTACCEMPTSTTSDEITYSQEYTKIPSSVYKVYGYGGDFTMICVCEIEEHEYIINMFNDYFIHSPNCKCNKETKLEKETCTSSDLSSLYSW
jgi:hypothetical protein